MGEGRTRTNVRTYTNVRTQTNEMCFYYVIRMKANLFKSSIILARVSASAGSYNNHVNNKSSSTSYYSNKIYQNAQQMGKKIPFFVRNKL